MMKKLKLLFRAAAFTMALLCGMTSEVWASQSSNLLDEELSVDLSFASASLKQLTDAITGQTGIVFSYETSMASKTLSNINIRQTGISVEQLLSKLFASTDITYKVVDKVVVLGIAAQNQSRDQYITVKGRVTDGASNGMIGVNVILKGTSTATSTGLDGQYSLSFRKTADPVLVFSFLGYDEQEVAVGTRTAIDVVLTENKMLIDEVVVVGYGTQSRRTVTSAISKVDGSTLESASVNSLGDALKGRISGVRIATTNNQPGADPTFLIRGGSSINQSNNPIILVDGVVRELTGLNSNDIESIEVLKDAASAGMYGARASNGVVMITTKKGSSSRAPEVTFQAQGAWESPATSFSLMNARDYLLTMRPVIAEGPDGSTVLAGANSAGTGNGASSIWTTRYLQDGEAVPDGWDWIYDPIYSDKVIVFQNNDQQSQWFSDAFWQNYYIGVNGGNKDITYASSVGYTDDGGIGVNTGYSRFTFHGNTSYKVTKNLTASSTFDYSQTQMQAFPDNYWTSVGRGLSIPATHRDVLDDGTPAQGTNNTTMTALWYKTYYDRNQTQKRASVNTNLTWNITNDLKAVAQLTNHNRHTRSSYYQKGNAISSTRPTSEGFSEVNRVNFQTYANYSPQFSGKHNLDITAGYDYTYDRINSLDAAVTGSVSDKVPTLGSGTVVTSGYPKNTYTRESLISYFGRANYNYDEKYLLSLTMRADASSKFAVGHQWGYFPSASAGWVISDEGFWNKQVMNLFKFRASYGLTGNNSIGLYDTYGSYNSTGVYNGQSVITIGDMPNTGLRWESTSQLDLGFDMAFLRDRIRLNVDYYNKVTRNLLMDITLPNTTGFSSTTDNIGRVRFYGFELDLSTINIKTKHFQWTTNFTYSFNMNKVLQLPDNGYDRNRIGGYQCTESEYKFGGTAEGERLGRIYGYKVAYIIETEAQANAALYDTNSHGYRRSDGKSIAGRKDVGDYEWVNREGSKLTDDGQEQINGEDMFLLGYALPHSQGGMNNSFRYKNLELNIYVDYALGHSVYNYAYTRFFQTTMGNCNYSLTYDARDCWKQPGDDTKLARLSANDADWGNKNFSRASDINIQKGDYLCLRDVTLSYDLPKTWARKIGAGNINIAISGNTLCYLTAVKGVSPEAGAAAGGSLYSASNTTSTSYNPYPPTRKVMFSAKITF